MKKNLLSVLLALVLVLSLTVLAAPAVFAEETTETTEPAAHSHCYCVNAETKPEGHVCDETITWEPYVKGMTLVDGGHYYLTGDTGEARNLTSSSNKLNITICLNGHTFRAQTPFKVQNGNTLTICDCQGGGAIRSSQTKATGYSVWAGYNGGVVNLYSGILSGYVSSTVSARPVVVEGGTFNMYGGSIIRGDSGTVTTGSPNLGYGGNVLVKNYVGSKTHVGTFNMFGGTISGGNATADGGNIYVLNGVLTLNGGTITGGTAVNGGNFALAGASSITATGGTISDGAASEKGGNIYTYSVTDADGKASNVTLTLNGTTLSGGTAGKSVETVTNEETQETTEVVTYTGSGGSIYIDVNGTLNIQASSSVISGCALTGGNIYSSATVNIKGGTVDAGVADSYGGNIFLNNAGTLNLESGIVTGGKAVGGGNVYSQGVMNITGGSIENGVTTGAGGNLRLSGTGAQLHMSAGIISGGYANNHGGNIYSMNVSQFYITGGEVKNGIAEGGMGGNLYVSHNDVVGTRRTVIENATISGGQSILAVSSEGNEAGGQGGNAYLRKCGKITITNATFANGKSSGGGGDNLYLMENTETNITGSTFTVEYGGRKYEPSSITPEEHYELYYTYGRNHVSTAEKWVAGNGGNICVASAKDYVKVDSETGEETVTESYVNISDCQIIGGLAENGGALYLNNADATLDGITAKSCGGDTGKVLCIGKTGNVTVKDSTLVNWGTAGTVIVNNGNLALVGNINTPKEYNAAEMNTNTYKVTQDVLTRCVDNADATTDISGLISVDADVVNVENVIYGDGVIRIGRSENVNADGDVLNTAGLVTIGVNDTNRALIVAHNSGFVLAERESCFYLDNATIQGIADNGNITCGGADFNEFSLIAADRNIAYAQLNSDLADAGELSVSIVLNLNGKHVTGATVAEGTSLSLADTANIGYDASKCGSFAGTINGTLEQIVHTVIAPNTLHFVILPNDDGSYSAHRYLAYISATSLKPAEAALGFTAKFNGDEYVRAVASGIGFNMWVNNGNAKAFKTNCDAWTSKDTTLSLRVKNMLVEGSDTICQIGASATVYGEAVIYFNIDGQEISATTSPKSVTLKSFIKSLNNDLVQNSANYTAAQMTAVQAMITKFSAYMEGWEYANIMAWTESAE